MAPYAVARRRSARLRARWRKSDEGAQGLKGHGRKLIAVLSSGRDSEITYVWLTGSLQTPRISLLRACSPLHPSPSPPDDALLALSDVAHSDFVLVRDVMDTKSVPSDG